MEQSQTSGSANPPATPADSEISQSPARSRWIGWSSFFFAAVQSVCSAFVALSGLRLLIGAAAFGSAVGVLKIADTFHVGAIRIPMMLLALFGSLFNLLAVWQVRRLRARSASAWRRKSLSPKQINAERLQLALSVLTLLLLALELYYHHKLESGQP